MGRYIRERQQRLFNTLGGNYDEVKKWMGRSCFEYYLYLEKLKAYQDENRRDARSSIADPGSEVPFSGK